jgi:hypothetical protein
VLHHVDSDNHFGGSHNFWSLFEVTLSAHIFLQLEICIRHAIIVVPKFDDHGRAS